MNRKFTAILLCLALSVSMFFTPEQAMAKKTKLKLNKKKVTLSVGKSVRLKVKGTKKKVKWKSNKKKVATVNAKGKVKAKAKGKAKITAKVAGKKLTCKVTVTKRTVCPPAPSQPSSTAGTAGPNAGTDPSATPTGGVGGADPSLAPSESADPALPQESANTGESASPKPTESAKPSETALPTSTPLPTAVPTAKPSETAKPTSSALPTPSQSAAPRPTANVGWNPQPVPTIEVKEKSFESGTDGFTAQGNADVQTADNGYEGKCLQVSGRTKESDGVKISIGSDVTAGESYSVWGYVKMASGSGTLSVKYQSGDSDASIKEFVTMPVSGQWVKFMGTFTVPTDFTRLDLLFTVQGTTGAFFLDEICIAEIVSMKGIYDNIFGKTGTCINPDQLKDPQVLAYVKKHYSSVTLENDMKPDYLMPTYSNQRLINTSEARTKTGNFVIPDNYTEATVPNFKYDTVDEVLKIAKENGLKIRYHVLVWHSQSPEWFFKEGYSTDESAAYVTPEKMYARMELYIRSVIHHVYTLDGGAYRDVVYTWDVANEYFSNTPDKNWSAVFGNREGNLENKPPFIKKAFEIAYDELEEFSLEESVPLFYNDFNTYLTTDKIVEMIHYINSEKKVCSGIGMQSHLGVTFPSVDSYVNTVQRFLEEGFEVQITELDVSCTSESDSGEELTPQQLMEAYDKQAAYVREITEKIVYPQKAYGGGISGLTWWGLYDERSWRKAGHVLMFDTGMYDAKPSYFAFMQASAVWNEPYLLPTLYHFDFTNESLYQNESPSGASHVVNADGSVTLTFKSQYAAYNFYLPESENDIAYKSVVLTYTSKGGNLGHSLYDGKGDKKTDWGNKITESPDGDRKIICNVTSDCAGGRITGFQIFNQNPMTDGAVITITIKSMIFCDKENPTRNDLDPKPSPSPEPTALPTETVTPEPTSEPTPTLTPEPTSSPEPDIKVGWNVEKTEYYLPLTSDYVFSEGGASLEFDDEKGGVTLTYNGQYPGVWFTIPSDVKENFSSIEFTYQDATEGGFGSAARYTDEDKDAEVKWGGQFPADQKTWTIDLDSDRGFLKYKIFKNDSEDVSITITSVKLKK